MNTYKYQLVKDTITKEDLFQLSDWIKLGYRLTKGELNDSFEKKWASWNGSNHAVFLNSGSSANLAMFYAEKCIRKKDNIKVIAPAISWVTTISPAIQLGMEIHLCDSDKNTLGVSIDHLEKLFIVRCFSMMEDRIFSHLSMSAEERYNLFFESNRELFNQVPLQYIASMLGMSPETFSRIRKKQLV